jgi:hypothetical protein
VEQTTKIGNSKRKRWFEGGTLQAVTMEKWQDGSLADRLATASDFIVSYLVSEGVDKESIQMDRIRPAAEWLVEKMEHKPDRQTAPPFLYVKPKGQGIGPGPTISQGLAPEVLRKSASEWATELLRVNPALRKLLRGVYD